LNIFLAHLLFDSIDGVRSIILINNGIFPLGVADLPVKK